jgi:hypothetical protein
MANQNKQTDPTMDKVGKGVAIVIVVALAAVVVAVVYKLIEWILGV